MALDIDHGAYHVSRETTRCLEHHLDLLRQWQKTHNLVAASTLTDLWSRHVADSIRLWPAVSAAWRHGSLVDLGSGAGFPGIVLAAIARERDSGPPGPVHLVESNGKKAAFLRHAARCLALDVTVHADRIETVAPRLARESVTVVTARALAPLDKLLALAEPLLIAGATAIFPKGRRFEVEVEAAKRYWDFDLQLCGTPAAASGASEKVGEVSDAGPALIVTNLVSR